MHLVRKRIQREDGRRHLEHRHPAEELPHRLAVRAAELPRVRDGLLGPPQGSKPREVLVKPDYFKEVDLARASED